MLQNTVRIRITNPTLTPKEDIEFQINIDIKLWNNNKKIWDINEFLRLFSRYLKPNLNQVSSIGCFPDIANSQKVLY